jgi:hypothetical protein
LGKNNGQTTGRTKAAGGPPSPSKRGGGGGGRTSNTSGTGAQGGTGGVSTKAAVSKALGRQLQRAPTPPQSLKESSKAKAKGTTGGGPAGNAKPPAPAATSPKPLKPVPAPPKRLTSKRALAVACFFLHRSLRLRQYCFRLSSSLASPFCFFERFSLAFGVCARTCACVRVYR